MKRTDCGFTLIEVMIVIVITGILLSVGVPALTDLVRNYRIVGQANDLTLAFALARTESVKRGGQITVCRSLNADSGSYVCGSGDGWEAGWLVFVDTNANAAVDVGEQVLLVHSALSGGNTLRGSTNVVSSVAFTSQGIVGAEGVGSFTLLDGRGGVEGSRLICMAVTGRTRVFSDGTTSCPGSV